MLNPTLQASVEKQCEKEIKFLIERFGTDEKGLLAKRLIDQQLSQR